MFSNDSRWDRHLPSQDHDEEPIEVGAVFARGRIVPKWFSRQGRRYEIREVTYHWEDRQGQEVRHYFAVTDGVNLYQITLNNRHLHWRLVKTCPL